MAPAHPDEARGAGAYAPTRREQHEKGQRPASPRRGRSCRGREELASECVPGGTTTAAGRQRSGRRRIGRGVEEVQRWLGRRFQGGEEEARERRGRDWRRRGYFFSSRVKDRVLPELVRRYPTSTHEGDADEETSLPKLPAQLAHGPDRHRPTQPNKK